MNTVNESFSKGLNKGLGKKKGMSSPGPRIFMIGLILFVIALFFVPTEKVETYEQIKIDSSLSKNSLNLTIVTDLPDDTKVTLSVMRSYWEKGDQTEYSLKYISKQTTVGQLKEVQTASLDNEKWLSDLTSKQKELALVGLGFDVEKISDSIRIYAVIPFSESFPKFKEKGMEEDEVILYYPIGRDNIESNYGSYRSLEIGRTYSVSEPTPLMPEINPSDAMEAIKKVKELGPQSRIKIQFMKKKFSIPWYGVKVLDRNNKPIGQGWINSNALIGQELRVIK